jgi:hypothetical protein
MLHQEKKVADCFPARAGFLLAMTVLLRSFLPRNDGSVVFVIANGVKQSHYQ